MQIVGIPLNKSSFMCDIWNPEQEKKKSGFFPLCSQNCWHDRRCRYAPLWVECIFVLMCTTQLEKATAPHSSTPAWKIPRMEEPGGLQSMASLGVDTTARLHFHFSLSCIGEGNGNPLQCSCLENPRDGGAWWAAVYGVAQSRTRLKRLSSSSSSTKYQVQLIKSTRSGI